MSFGRFIQTSECGLVCVWANETVDAAKCKYVLSIFPVEWMLDWRFIFIDFRPLNSWEKLRKMHVYNLDRLPLQMEFDDISNNNIFIEKSV